jgi:hypothetical protein
MGCYGEYLDLRRRKWREAGKYCIMRSPSLLRVTNYHQDNAVKEDEMGWACSTHEKHEKCIQIFCRIT